MWVPEPVRGVGDREIARIADRQRGTVHRRQLLTAGLSRHAIAHRVANERLFALHRDVFLVGRNTLEPLGRETAAALQLDGHGVLSHESAGALWGLLDAEDVDDVTMIVFGRDRRSQPGLRLHRAPAIRRGDIRRRRGLPVTSPARAVVDLASVLPRLELENACAEPIRREIAREGEIRAAIDRAPRRARGIGLLRSILDACTRGDGPALTRSRAERRLLALLRAAELPRPVANATVCGHMVDFLWPEHRVIVEFDGWDVHGRRQSFETDRRRDQRLVAAGYRVIRVTWRQLEHEAFALIARLAALLA